MVLPNYCMVSITIQIKHLAAEKRFLVDLVEMLRKVRLILP